MIPISVAFLYEIHCSLVEETLQTNRKAQMVPELEKDPLDMYRTCCPYECQDPEKWKKPKCLLVKGLAICRCSSCSRLKKKQPTILSRCKTIEIENGEIGLQQERLKAQPIDGLIHQQTNPYRLQLRICVTLFLLKERLFSFKVLGHVANPFSNTCFFWGGGFCQSDLVPTNFVPQKNL